MLESLMRNQQEIEQLLCEKSQLSRLSGIDIYRSLKFVDEATRAAAHAFLQTELAKDITEIELQGSPKRARVEVCGKERFSAYQDDHNATTANDEMDELTDYLSMKFSVPDDNFNILEYWKNNTMFPKLRRIALWLLAIPASSTPSERTFSTTGYTLNARRTELSGGTLSMLTYLHKNAS
ncbi:unnamed protein product [Allacma fusca]|uniref:HAT C-terminal dimerisation domain-containing protein n=1 Tax=Allacma fusca TaxID=39272 RepID=A0A8J2K8M5_9HEXA|nr:unnamed protein product [Allacma fusca]